MTCIAALMDKTHIYLGGDRLISDGHVGSTLVHSKVFKIGTMLIGSMGSLRASQIISHHLELPKDTRCNPIDYMIQDLIPEIRRCLEFHKYTGNDNKGRCGNYVLCYRSKIFVIQEDWSVCELNIPYTAIGSGGVTADGALFVLTNVETQLNTNDKLKMAILAAGNHIISCGNDIDIIRIKKRNC
jgi:ATP-dependent protease HslVU (ClpYQ) peptidase subunit